MHSPKTIVLVVALAANLCASGAMAQRPPMEQPPAEKPPAATTPPADTPAATSDSKRMELPPVDVKWLDRMAKDDRAAVDELPGWAPPAFVGDLEWVGSQALTWDGLRGKVVVIQSFTTGTMAGRGWPARIAKALEEHTARDLRIIALHTPEEADAAREFLGKKPAPEGVAVAIDTKGAYCDALAIYKQPMNVVVDRNGAVRYAGLNLNGLEAAVKQLVAEPFNQNLAAPQREGAEGAGAASASAGEFPPFTGTIESAIDIRGKRAPEFHVDQWLNTDEAPNAKGKVVVVDFWATWCPPCVASIPHMNDLANRFRDDAVCVGISDEKPNDFDNGLAKLKSKKITMKTFQYALALDPDAKMKGAINVRGIPHCLVMDRNWIVRWQGHPATLDAGTLEKIIKADKASGGGGGGDSTKPGGNKRKRWTTA